MKYKQYRQHLLVKKPGGYWNHEGRKPLPYREVILGNGQKVNVAEKSLGEPLGVIHSAAPPDERSDVLPAFYMGAFLGMMISLSIIHFIK